MSVWQESLKQPEEPQKVWKSKRGLTNGGLKPQLENRRKIRPIGLFGADWGLFGAYRGLFGTDRDELLRTSQPRGKSKCPERARFGPIGAFQAKPHLLSPHLDIPEKGLSGLSWGWAQRIFQTFSGFRAQTALETSVRGEKAPNHAVLPPLSGRNLAHSTSNLGARCWSFLQRIMKKQRTAENRSPPPKKKAVENRPIEFSKLELFSRATALVKKHEKHGAQSKMQKRVY